MENLFSCLPLDSDEPQPWLLISQQKNLHRHTFYSPSKKQYFRRKIPELHMKQVSCASYGWLFIIDRCRSKQPLDCYLLNPSAPQHKIQLPPIEIDLDTCQCVLSKPPTEADCRVLILAYRSLFYCQLGDERFIQETSDEIHLATSLNGKIYSCIERGGILSFVEVDFVGEGLVLNELRNNTGKPCQIPWPSPHWEKFSQRLVEYSGNDFLLVHMNCYPHSGAEAAYFRVFKVNVIEMECEELMSIGDRAILVAEAGGISLLCTENSSLKRNSIYFEAGCGRNVHVYDMEDRSKTIFRACSSVGPHFKSWIMI